METFRSPLVKRPRLSIENGKSVASSNGSAPSVEEEKRRRKNQRFDNFQAQTPAALMRRKSIGIDKDVLNSQLKAHYSLCIQLSNSNKINSNNAFGLHLIDHMDSVMRSLKSGNLNFKLASSTLDAGTKIYCGRVDSVHSEAQKVASALVNALDNQKNKGKGAGATNAGGELDDEDHENDLEEGENEAARPGAKRKNKKVKTVCSAESVTLSKIENTIESDQIFLKINSAFDMATLDSLLVNNLHASFAGQLIIDSKSKLEEMQSSTLDNEAEKETNDEFVFEVNSLNDALKPEARICARLDNFRFDNRMEAIEKAEESMFAFRDMPEDDIVENNMFGDYDIGDDLMPDNIEDAGDYDFGLPNTETDELPGIPGNELRNMNAKDISNMIRMFSDKPNEYTYFDRKLMYTWAGPNFWKRRIVNVSNEPKTANKRMKKTYEKIKFDEYIDDVVFLPKESRKLSLPTFEKWMENKNQLPEYFWHDPMTFVKPFYKDHYNNFRIKTFKDTTTPTLTQETEPVASQQENNFALTDDYGDNYDGMDHNQSFTSQFDANPTEEFEVELDSNKKLVGDNLIDQPYEIEHIDIPYAKFAKKVDVKRLKGLIWDVVQHPPDQSMDTSIVESQQSQSSQNTKSITKELGFDDAVCFSTLYSEITHRVTPTVAQNISPAIAFVTLLHTVNEKGLQLVKMETEKDFIIVNPHN